MLQTCIKGALAAWILGGSVGASAQTFSLYRIQSTEHQSLEAVSQRYEIVGRKGDLYDVYVPLSDAETFRLDHPKAKLIQKDADSNWRPQWNSGLKLAAGYHDFEAVQTFMTESEQTHPDLARVETYGKTQQGRTLSYLKLGSSNADQVAKPKLFLDAATHGDELISTEVLIALTKELLSGYGKDERLTEMLDRSEIYISFVVNPDGFVNQQRYEGWVDPNRSYPWPGDPSKKPTKSIQALIDLFEKERFAGSMTFHAYGKLLMYPWGYSRDPIENTEDRLGFEALTTKLAFSNDYTFGSIAETIYVAKGSSADFYYWKYGTKALAVELSTSKVPPASRIPAVVNEAREMVWDFIEHFYL